MKTQETIEQKLDRLANLRDGVDAVNLRYKDMHDSVLTPEILEKLNDIEAERKTAIQSLQEGATKLEEEITALVLKEGQSIKGTYLQAVYSKPRESWDTAGLIGFAVAHPEMAAFRKVAESGSVSFRVRK